MRIIALAAVMFFTVTAAHAESFPVIKDATVLKECGACHMAFPPQTLSQAVWTKIIGNLGSHFGEDASLDTATVATILDYHLKNANDVNNDRASKRWRTDKHVTRISEVPRFIERHKGCETVWAYEKVKSKANCAACHNHMQTSGTASVNVKFLPAAMRKTCGEQ